MSDFSEEEWESVCMRCGKCCLEKGTHDGEILFFNRVCDGLDLRTGLCTRYKKRLCENCAKVDLTLLQTEPSLLPESCAYRLLLAGKDLPAWHPLVSGDRESVFKTGKSVLNVFGLHSDGAVKVELQMLSVKSRAEGWDLKRIKDEAEKLFKKYPLRVVEKYPAVGNIKLL
uniref:Uncharacterized protein n=1 Tax=uncultured Alphaproteobacteria bacterium TaxID=91750 RepID=A0A6G8F2F5_9PROT|nr:hypothetical protein PlAlph_1160 [uncultured Alphaproteobacteria bacterium]